MSALYADQAVALLTRHGKEALLGPLLEPALGCRIVHTDAYDTDQLGTFLGDVPRIGTQIEAARKKARIGMDLTGASIGLASEGAFVPDPFGGLMPWNIETVVWLDDRHALEIVGLAQGPARHIQASVRWLPELERVAIEAGFPEHHLVIRPETATDPRVHKDIADWAQLKSLFKQCQMQSANQLVFVENDLRAFCSPSRQAMIRQAGADLLKKIQSQCMLCHLPGFWITGHQAGLPCRHCGRPTRLARSYTWSCMACMHTEERAVNSPFADPGRCDHCNP